MSDRQAVFESIRAAIGHIEEPVLYPDWDPAIADSRFVRSEKDTLELFRQQLESAGGVYLDSWDALANFLGEQGVKIGYADPLLPDAASVLEGFECVGNIKRENIDDYEFGVTGASGAIAETGTLIFGDTDCPYRLAALAPWIHIAVVSKDSIVRSVTEAIPLFKADPSIIFATGPSKTADIEGILIKGVHGPGIQACLVV